jgi:hypothetical protein
MCTTYLNSFQFWQFWHQYQYGVFVLYSVHRKLAVAPQIASITTPPRAKSPLLLPPPRVQRALKPPLTSACFRLRDHLSARPITTLVPSALWLC